LSVHGVQLDEFDRAPDFYSLGTVYFLLLALALCLSVIGLLAFVIVRAYVRQNRKHTFSLAATLLMLCYGLQVVVHLGVVTYTLAVAGPIPVATTRHVSAESLHPQIGLRASKNGTYTVDLTFTSSRPELPLLGGAEVVAQPNYNQWALLQFTNSTVSLTNTPARPQRHSAQHWDRPRPSTHPETVEKVSLARTNGPFSVWFPGFRVLNDLRATNLEPQISFEWEGVAITSKLTNWTHALIMLRLPQVESRCRIERRESFAAYQARPPHALLASLGKNASEPHFSVAWKTIEASVIKRIVYNDWEPVGQVCLWHPQRKEILLPDKHFQHYENRSNVGVTALAAEFPLNRSGQLAQFPHTPAGQPPQPGAPGPEWFEQAEIIYLSYLHLSSPHHVVELDPIPLPPVTPKP
jgi:hypothetical protein